MAEYKCINQMERDTVYSYLPDLHGRLGSIIITACELLAMCCGLCWGSSSYLDGRAAPVEYIVA